MKYLKHSLLFVLMTICGTLTSSADEYSYDGLRFEYASPESETCILTSAQNYAVEDFTVPTTVDIIYRDEYGEQQVKTMTITGIGNGAFSWNRTIKNITLQGNIKRIDNGAFADCSSLVSVEMSNVTSIGYSAFDNCKALESVIMHGNGETVELGDDLFQNCTALETVVLPEGLKSINTFNFFNDYNFRPAGSKSRYIIKQITIPSTLTEVDGSFFRSLDHLEEVIFNDGYTELADDLFNNCSVVKVNLPSSLKKIGAGAFAGCRSLEPFTLPGGLTEIGEGAFVDCEKFDTKIPSTVKIIGESAFRETGITKAVIPDGVTEISDYLFCDCKKLKTVTLPSSTTSIGVYAFGGCEALESIKLPDGLQTIGRSCFRNSGIHAPKLPSSITVLGDYVFAECKNLGDVTIPASIVNIQSYAFYDCEGKSLEIEGGEEDLLFSGKYSFYKSVFDNVTIGNRKFVVDESAPYPPFAYSGIKHVVYTDKAKVDIARREFYNCTELESIVIGSSVKSVGNQAFSSCSSLKKLTIKESKDTLSLGYNAWVDDAVSVGKGLFYYCPLEEIVLMRNISYNDTPNYGYSPFYDRTSLKKLTLGTEVTEIGKYLFAGCSELNYIDAQREYPPTTYATTFAGVNKKKCDVHLRALMFEGYYKDNEYWEPFWLTRFRCLVTVPETKSAAPWFEETVKIPADVEAYTAKTVDNTKSVVLSPIKNGLIPAKTGVIIKAMPGEYMFEGLDEDEDEPDEIEDNLLVGVPRDGLLQEGDYNFYELTFESATRSTGSPVFSLGNESGAIRATANTAYLKLPKTIEAQSIAITFDETGENAIDNPSAQSLTGALYNLSGQKVSNSYRGVVITADGKKILKK